MGDVTKIQWCHHTHNPWVGCSKVHAGCLNCYAEERRHFAEWGPHGTRVITSPENWRKPLKWDRDAASAGERRRVFCASLADVFEDWAGKVVDSHGSSPTRDGRMLRTLDEVRAALFELIDATPHLDWLLLTKRPENVRKMWPGGYRENVWVGTSVSEQATADEFIPHLDSTFDLCPVAFVSYEPAIGPVDFRDLFERSIIDWVIVGGESGVDARPFNIEWAESIVKHCAAAKTPCFMKQLGSNPKRWGGTARFCCTDRKGGDPEEWPESLRVRQFPEPSDVS